MADDTSGVLDQFRDDGKDFPRVFKQFLSDEFDAKAVACSAIQDLSIAQHLGKLATGISLLDKELHTQVSAHYEDLLAQATGIETLESALQTMFVSIQNLQQTSERLQSKVVEPYNKTWNQTAMLARLQHTCDMIRRIGRLFQLVKRLQTQMQGGAKEITKAAQRLNEADQLLEGVDLSGVDVVQEELAFIAEARQSLERQAEKMLEKGTEAQNKSQVGVALQVLFHLQLLQPRVMQLVRTTTERLRESVRCSLSINSLDQQASSTANAALGARVPGRSSMPVTGSSAVFRAALWTNMDRLVDHVCQACGQIQQLEQVLAKKKDPVTHSSFLQELSKSGHGDILHSFWLSVAQTLSDELARAAAEEALCGTLSPLENAYLTRSLSRLLDAVNVALSGSTRESPSHEDLDGILRAIASELRVAAVDARLCRTVAKNVAQAVHQLAARCEQLTAVDGAEALQVIGPATAEQQCNAALLHLLHRFQGELSATVETVIQGTVQPLLSAVAQSVEAIILTMHEEDFSTPASDRTAVPDAPCSLYMRELQQFVAHCQTDYFAAWPPSETVTQGIRGLASRALELLARHASLVRPLGDGGKMRLAADFAQIEMALAPLGQPLAELGRPYKAASWSRSRYSKWLDEHPSEKERLVLIRGAMESYVQMVHQRQGKEFAPVYPVMKELLQKAMELQRP
ncbi:conserved hypothetical protein [Ixodes scapularis]|uniref:Conserved oligomeric Golgi complex subunit 5 n=1 Tax=Ixodes scapularis TaxID=6945 RepID=B7PD42_IXOSC|nr:conserved hypothetical protein [Ixodes scapularis]|eukprot:XP_002410604.1 conserved hypothetical protein [Ixodes scapularis]